ncbi:hypothetical protein [uncultured Arsenicicoccus sp.]|uniref:hypothetical protein n=1 Tax=uncultured Arsenicicoccus sp. TaxID=491339 RepID=UPI00259A1B34|nr:hypothetical protein [uncultured Arsenicicoccus sp.]
MPRDLLRNAKKHRSTATPDRLAIEDTRLNAAMTLLTRDTRAIIARINAERDAAIAAAWLEHAERATALTAAAYGPGA